MTTAIDYIHAVKNRGVALWTKNGRLCYQAIKPIPGEVLKFLKWNKAAIFDALERHKIELGRIWIGNNLGTIKTGGFTDRDFFNKNLPIGLLYGIEWDLPTQTIRIVDGIIDYLPKSCRPYHLSNV